MLNHPELLDRVFQPAVGTFPADLARQIMELHFPLADHAKYEELSAKAQDGSLTADEQAMLDDYLNLNDFLIILKTKAQASLSKTNSAA